MIWINFFFLILYKSIYVTFISDFCKVGTKYKTRKQNMNRTIYD